MTDFLILIFLGILILCVLATSVKVVLGPGMPDRLIAGSMSTHILTFILAIAGVYGNSDLLFDAALVAALVSFSATVVMAKYLVRKKVL